MIRTKLSLVLATISIGMLPASASANDLVNLLRALQGPPQQHIHQTTVVQPVSHRSLGHSSIRGDVRRGDVRRGDSRVVISRPPVVATRSRASLTVSFGGSPFQPAPRPVYVPQPPAPIFIPQQPVYPSPIYQQPIVHQVGEIVTCQVPLETCVVVKDQDEIAPGAVPIVIAVQDPHQGRYQAHNGPPQLVFIQVFAPPCPPQRVKVSPCGTRIRMDYGRFEIDIVSRNGVIEVDYDN